MIAVKPVISGKRAVRRFEVLATVLLKTATTEPSIPVLQVQVVCVSQGKTRKLTPHEPN
jgi:hypothetical protein